MNETRMIREHINQLPVGSSFTVLNLKDILNLTVPTRNISAFMLQIFRQNRDVLIREEVSKEGAPHLMTFKYTKVSEEKVWDKRKPKDEDDEEQQEDNLDGDTIELTEVSAETRSLGIGVEIDELVIKILTEHRNKIISLAIELSALQEKYNALQKELELMREKKRALSEDYNHILEENKQLKDLCQGYQQKILEKQEEINKLRGGKKISMNLSEFQDKYGKFPTKPKR